MTTHRFICLFLGIVCFHLSFAQNEVTSDSIPVSYERRVYTTASVAGMEEIKIDGLLDDAAWDAVEWTSDYVEFEPDNASDPTEQTKMKIAALRAQ